MASAKFFPIDSTVVTDLSTFAYEEHSDYATHNPGHTDGHTHDAILLHLHGTRGVLREHGPSPLVESGVTLDAQRKIGAWLSVTIRSVMFPVSL